MRTWFILIPLPRSVVDLLKVEAAGWVEGGAVGALPGVEGVVREKGGGQLEEGGRGGGAEEGGGGEGLARSLQGIQTDFVPDIMHIKLAVITRHKSPDICHQTHSTKHLTQHNLSQ